MLEEIGQIVTGKTPSSNFIGAFSSSGIPFVTPKDMDGRRWIETTERYLSEAGRQSLKNYLVPKDSVAVSCIGSDMGKAILLKKDSVTNQQINTIIVDASKHNPKYIYYVLSLKQEELKSIAGGSATPILNKGHFSKVVIELPDKVDQDNIVQVLDSLDCKIELNNQINQNLESMAQAIFKSWFIDFDPVRAKIAAKQNGEDPELAAMCAISGKSETELEQMAKEDFAELQATAALFPDELVESELGEVPKGWEYKKLKDLCRVINGRAYKNTEFKEEGIPIVRIQNLTGGGKTVFSDLDLPQDKLIEKEDFIYAWSATFGPYIWRGPKSIYHYHIWKMDVDETIISRYFLYLTMFRKTESMKSAGTGSIFTHLTKVIMESQDVLIADKAVNILFKDRVDKIFKLLSLKHDEINNLQNLRDTLLPKLLSGELDVSGLQGEGIDG